LCQADVIVLAQPEQQTYPCGNKSKTRRRTDSGQKRMGNGNIKKQIAWQTIGGPDAERLVESLLSVQHIEIAVTVAPEPGVKMAKNGREFEKVVKNMGIWKNE